MSFDGPELRDYRNVVALNSAYLKLIGSERVLARGIAGCQEPLRQRILSLHRKESERLAETPFLLFSFRERDDGYWDGILDESREPGLFRQGQRHTHPWRRQIQPAAIRVFASMRSIPRTALPRLSSPATGFACNCSEAVMASPHPVSALSFRSSSQIRAAACGVIW